MRVENWSVALSAYLDNAVGEFKYGITDCCQFIAEAVLAVTGEDKRNLFPAYSTEAEAAAILESHGGLDGLITRALGPSMHPAWMQRGDICLIPDSRGILCAGVYVGQTVAVRAPRRLERPLRKFATVAWAVR